MAVDESEAIVLPDGAFWCAELRTNNGDILIRIVCIPGKEEEYEQGVRRQYGYGVYNYINCKYHHEKLWATLMDAMEDCARRMRNQGGYGSDWFFNF